MKVCVWLALLTACCCGSSDEGLTTEFYENETAWTQTPEYDYDYNTTFDYYYVTGPAQTENRNKAELIGRFSPVLLLGLAVHHI